MYWCTASSGGNDLIIKLIFQNLNYTLQSCTFSVALVTSDGGEDATQWVRNFSPPWGEVPATVREKLNNKQ